MKLEEMTIEQLTAELEALDAQRQMVRERAREVKAVLNAKLEHENAALHGLSVDDYNAVKQIAKESDVELRVALSKARRIVARGLQVVKALPVSLEAKASPSGK